jgi:hypothetical protein
LNVKSIQVPLGRPTFSNEMMDNAEIIRHPFSRPCGTCAGADGYPALKRRAIIGLSPWDGRKAGGRTFGMPQGQWGAWLAL